MTNIDSITKKKFDQFLQQLEIYFTDQYECSKNPLETKEVFLSRKMNETIQSLQKAEALAIQGLSSFKKSKQTSPIVKKMIEESHSATSSGLSAQDYLSLSDEEMMQLYQQARQTLNKANYQESLGMFIFLITLNGANFEYPLGAALSLFLSGNNKEAKNYYDLALSLANKNPKVSLFAADFFYCTGEVDKASELVHEALDNFDSKDNPLFEEAKLLKTKVDLALKE